MKKFSIAIDGPAGAGKSTIAKKIAKLLDCVYIDTGAMYRTVGLYCIKNNIDCANEQAVNESLQHINIDITYKDGEQLIYLNESNVTQLIRNQEVAAAASKVAIFLQVREALVNMQRAMQETKSVVMDGRDIGTVVLPNATLKIFLTASAEERAKRRFIEYQEKGIDADYDTILGEIRSRDHQDYNRKVSPLKKAEDAHELDTTNMGIDEIVETVSNLLKERMN